MTNETSGQKIFEPLEIIGYFWTFFGIIVAGATFFIQPNQYVPEVRAVVTNLIAAFLLLLAGGLCIYYGRKRKARRLASANA